jgi:plastocyanin
MVEFTPQTPGVLTLVDHSLFRIHQGAAATFTVTGPNNPAIITSIKNGTGPAPSAGTMSVTSETQTTTSANQSSTNSTQVMIENFAYNPVDITVPVGTTVTWVNQDSVGHTVTEGDPNSPKPANLRVFDSSGEGLTGKVALIGPGQSWSYTFTTPGTYEYYCIVHPYMIGQVTVTAASGSAASQVSGYQGPTTTSVGSGGIVAFSAMGVVILVAIMLVLAKPGREQEESSPQAMSHRA